MPDGTNAVGHIILSLVSLALNLECRRLLAHGRRRIGLCQKGQGERAAALRHLESDRAG